MMRALHTINLDTLARHQTLGQFFARLGWTSKTTADDVAQNGGTGVNICYAFGTCDCLCSNSNVRTLVFLVTVRMCIPLPVRKAYATNLVPGVKPVISLDTPCDPLPGATHNTVVSLVSQWHKEHKKALKAKSEKPVLGYGAKNKTQEHLKVQRDDNLALAKARVDDRLTALNKQDCELLMESRNSNIAHSRQTSIKAERALLRKATDAVQGELADSQEVIEKLYQERLEECRQAEKEKNARKHENELLARATKRRKLMEKVQSPTFQAATQERLTAAGVSKKPAALTQQTSISAEPGDAVVIVQAPVEPAVGEIGVAAQAAAELAAMLSS